MGALFLAAYLLIAVGCVALGWYLSEPGRTLLTLPGDVFGALFRRSRPAPVDPSSSVPHDEPAMPVDEHNAETQYHLSVPEVAPTSPEPHGEPAPTDAVSKIIEGALKSKFFAGLPSEPEPAEAVHDEP